MSNIGPVGEVLYRRGHRDTYKCPLCSSIENNKHLLVCTSQEMVETFAQELDELNRWLIHNAPDNVRLAIIELLSAHHELREPEWENVPTESKQASKEQWYMGSQLLLWGVLSNKWRKHMDQYLRNSRKKAAIRLALISNKIWNITDKMWNIRNEHEHKNHNSEINKQRNDKADYMIDEIYDSVPPRRFLPMSDRQFFNANPRKIKNRKLKDKLSWVRRAKMIISRYKKVGNSTKEARILRNFLIRSM